MRSQVRVLSLRPKNSRKQAILTYFRLFFYIFFTKSAIFGWPHVCPNFEHLDCFFTMIFPSFQKIPFLCLLRCKFWGLTDLFLPALVLIISTNWNLIICKNILAQILPLEFLSSSPWIPSDQILAHTEHLVINAEIVKEQARCLVSVFEIEFPSFYSLDIVRCSFFKHFKIHNLFFIGIQCT